jgi:hypothetical protein
VGLGTDSTNYAASREKNFSGAVDFLPTEQNLAVLSPAKKSLAASWCEVALIHATKTLPLR